MLFALIGLVLIGLKYFEVAPVASWAWWIVLSPFGAALIWWWIADYSGLTARRAADAMDDKAQRRREANMAAIGVRPEAIQAARAQYRARKRQR